jgi:hypothetical protein
MALKEASPPLERSMSGLKELGMPYEYTEIVIFAVGGLLLLLGALAGPETRHVELS